MNIAFFITPKSDVACININSTIRQTLEKMEYHRFTAIPVLDDDGKYIGTITEGDILWTLKKNSLNMKDTEKIKISEISRHMINEPISISSNIDDIIMLAVNQNFVPAIDDNGVFIGIIKRSDIIKYCYDKLFKKED